MNTKARLTTPATRRDVVTTGAKLASAAALAAAGICSTKIGANAGEITCDSSAALNGQNETDGEGTFGLGDPNGTGTACIDIVGTGTLCWDIQVAGIRTPRAAHIHRGRRTENGPIVMDFEGQLSGCKDVNGTLLEEIRRSPSGFYVNVHNRQHPGGAVRGQLRRVRRT